MSPKSQAWREASLEQRRPEHDLVEQLIGELSGKREHTAYLALRALDTVVAPEEHELIASALAGAETDGGESPTWATRSRVLPSRARRASDPWGTIIELLLAFDDPEPHDLLVGLSTTGGRMANYVVLLDAAERDQWLQEEDLTVSEAPVEEALAEIADVLWQTDLYWPRQVIRDYSDLRALAHARTREHLVRTEPESLSDEDRRVLIDEFVAEQDTDQPEDVVRLLADTFIDFGDGYLDGDVLAWSPQEVDRFMLDWVPRKVILDRADHAALPEVLRAWLPFALRRRGLAPEHITPCVEEVGHCEEPYAESYDDESSWGLSRQVVSSLLADGVDLSDKDSVEQGMRAYNAQQLARSLREGTTED